MARIVPVMSERSEVKLDAQRADKRLAHWREVVSAMSKAAAPVFPMCCCLLIAAGRQQTQAPARVHPGSAGHGRLDCAAGCCTYANASTAGPEGGYRPRERIPQAAGYAGLRLGPRILRTETAGIAAIAALQVICWVILGESSTAQTHTASKPDFAAYAITSRRLSSSAAKSGTIASSSLWRTRANTPAGNSPPLSRVTIDVSVTVNKRGPEPAVCFGKARICLGDRFMWQRLIPVRGWDRNQQIIAENRFQPA